MVTVRIIAIVMIVAGVLGLVYSGFSYSRGSTKVGPVELSIKEGKTIAIPVWAGVSSIAVGSLILLF